ncbi:MAG: MarR family transcriptional regulator [Microbacterium sp.]|uniref:MarR family winged helix-turn-helix transcriptional regulator n=1 Tax=Microbacterium sp. TaxID=51671 RepID=UPI0039E30F34
MWSEFEATPWDHADRDLARGQRVMRALRRFELAELAMRDRCAAAMNVSEGELLALRHVIRRQREQLPTTPTDIAHHLEVKPAAVTGVIDHLERAGHLVRGPHPSDRRSTVLTAVPAAAARIDEIYGAVYRTMMDVAAGLDDAEAERTEALLNALADAIDGFATVAADS